MKCFNLFKNGKAVLIAIVFFAMEGCVSAAKYRELQTSVDKANERTEKLKLKRSQVQQQHQLYADSINSLL